MALLTYILLLHFLNYTLAKNCDIDNTPDYITWEKELVKGLECGYSSHDAPSENAILKFIYIMEAFNFDSEMKVMTMRVRMNTLWKDERLKWDPEKHHGIIETDVSKRLNVWKPYVEAFDSMDFLVTHMPFYHFTLKSTGDVDGKVYLLQEVRCRDKLTNWPYDVQECSYEMVVKKSSWDKGNFTINHHFKVIDRSSAAWYIYGYKPAEDKRQTKFTFILMREAVGLSAIFICPAIVLTVLSVLSMCLDVRRKVRLAIICFSLLGHYYFLTELSYDIPKESHFPPTLLLYYHSSVILSVIIILLTFSLAAMCKIKSTPHNYVKLINDFVYENKYRTYLVFPRWDFDDDSVEIKPSSEDWVKFANIVNSAFKFCIVFAYIGLYNTKVPKRILYEANSNE